MDNPSENSDGTEVKVRTNNQHGSGSFERPPLRSERITPPKTAKKSKKSLPLGVIGAMVALLLVVASIAWFVQSRSIASTIDDSAYQAVFFTNGQVYFGKLQVVNREYMRIEKVFYLQAKTDAEANTKNKQKNPQQTSAQDNSNVELVKLGSEIHGPNDEMIVSRDQVLFFENLKSDSDVSTTIAEYLKKNT